MKRRLYISPQEEIPENKKRIKSAEMIWKEDCLLKIPKKKGMAINPESLRLSTPFFPDSVKANMAKIPLALMVSPFVEENCLKIFKESEIKIPKCEKCGAYFCNKTKIDHKKNKMICASCYNAYLPKETFESMNFDVSSNESFEIITEMEKIQKYPGDFIFIGIDVSEFSIEGGYCQEIARSLSKIFDSLDERKNVVLVTFDETIRIYDPSKERVFEILDLYNAEIPPIRFTSIKKSKTFYQKVLKDLEETKEKGIMENCIGSIYELIPQILTYGGIALVFSASYSTCGPRYIRRDKKYGNSVLFEKKKLLFYQNIAQKMCEMSISLHLFYLTDGEEDINIYGVPSALTSGSIHVYSDIRTKNESILMKYEIEKVLKDKYLCNTVAELIIPPFLKLRSISTNGIYNGNNQISLSNFPEKDSFLFEVEFKDEKSKAKTNFSVFQVILSFVDENGNMRKRVLTYGAPTTNDATKVRENSDQIIVLAALSRRFVTWKLSYPMDFAVGALLKYRDPRILSLLKFFADSPVLRDEHPMGEDGRTADLIALKTYDPVKLMLYICKRVEYFGNDEKELFCMAVESVSAVAFAVTKYATEDWLKSAFGVSSVNELPHFLPQLNTKENRILWNFATKYTKNCNTVVYAYRNN